MQFCTSKRKHLLQVYLGVSTYKGITPFIRLHYYWAYRKTREKKSIITISLGQLKAISLAGILKQLISPAHTLPANASSNKINSRKEGKNKTKKQQTLLTRNPFLSTHKQSS